MITARQLIIIIEIRIIILSAILFAAGDQRLTAENRTVRVNQQSIISQCLVKQNLAN